MPIIDVFKKKRHFATVNMEPAANRRNVPDNTWTLCPHCKKMLLIAELNDNLRVCYECGHYFRLTAAERIKYTCDAHTYTPLQHMPVYANPLRFEGYNEKRKAGIRGMTDEGVVAGTCKIDGASCVICVMDSHFMMGSMGADVGERMVYAIEYAIAHRMPLVAFTCSGGARMQEGLVSLMQMAKVSGALGKLAAAKLPYIVVLTDPTTGGVTASFAMLGDYTIAERGATIGFAGKRVIEQTIRQRLPEGFQTADFQQDHGFVDVVASRRHVPETVAKILRLHA